MATGFIVQMMHMNDQKHMNRLCRANHAHEHFYHVQFDYISCKNNSKTFQTTLTTRATYVFDC